jgi:hypothetical protein
MQTSCCTLAPEATRPSPLSTQVIPSRQVVIPTRGPDLYATFVAQRERENREYLRRQEEQRQLDERFRRQEERFRQQLEEERRRRQEAERQRTYKWP